MAKKCSLLWNQRIKPGMIANKISSQRQLARLSGLSEVEIWRLKYAKSQTATMTTLNKLGKALNINADVLARYFNEGGE